MNQNEFSLAETYQSLDHMIQGTSELLNKLVIRQGDNIALYYPRQTLYLCLTRQFDNQRRICGVCWRTFKPGQNKRIWLKAWSVKSTPTGSLKKIMDDDGRVQFERLHSVLKVVTAFRKKLISKKMRILATLQTVEDLEKRRLPKLEDKLKEALRS